MQKCLVVVDMQNDFIDGALGTKEAVVIVDNVCKKIMEYSKNHWHVYFTQDTHNESYLKTPEGDKLPVKHCVYRTNGWLLNDKVAKCKDGRFYVESYEKSTFGSKDLCDAIKNDIESGYGHYDEIELIGLCTDICVVTNAIMIKNALYDKFVEVTVDASCCAGTTPEKHKAALEVMKSCQINVINE